MTENQRDSGLLRSVGPLAFAASLFNAIIGAGIFVVPAALSASMGPYAPLAFVVCAIAIGSAALCLAEGGSRVPTSGGIYGYIEVAFGPMVGYVTGTALWFGNILACGGVAAALGDLVAGQVPPSYAAAVRAATIVGLVGGIALVNVAGARQGARLASVATVLKLLPLLIFIAAGALALQGSSYATSGPPSLENVDRGILLALFAFTGMEVTLSASGEVAQPARSIPRALALSISAVALLYISIQVIAQGILGPALAHSSTPLADAMARVSPLLRWLMLATATVSMIGWLSSDFLGSPRMLFAFGRDGMLPRVLGRVHEKGRTPYVAILFYATLAIFFALTGTFAKLAVLATLASALLYGTGSAAAWVLARRGVAQAGPPLNSRWLGPAAIVAVGSMLAMIGLAAVEEIVGILALIVISSLVYVLSVRFPVARRG
ncbi:MAG TPA: amino acid permease [Steroidobacteraceae bacterium]|nr:amino acid permease [Steroidobacteraceae bacterium]